MLFNSTDFLLLLATSLLLYWATPWVKLRQLIALGASIIFYMSWSAPFAAMLLIVVGVNWLLGWQIDRSRSRGWLIATIIANLGLLGWFKYANFFADNLGWLGHEAGIDWTAPHWQVILPLGISFYTFEVISYLTDIYRGKIRHERNPVVFTLFVMFFPHLIAGPICRFGQLMPQFKAKQPLDLVNVYNGCYLFLCGFVLKTCIADGLAPTVNLIFKSPETYSGLENTFGALGFGIQILCDFWGYSLMALGSGLLFGYALPQNFNAPYAAVSIRDFWRRWHMTLSSWLRDYLYIPLGGSRVDAAWKMQRNLFITMLLGGLWHGASWTFLIWGGLHGLALIVNHTYEKLLPAKVANLFSWKPLAWLLTMLAVFTAWIFFRAWSLEAALTMLARIGTPDAGWFGLKIKDAFFELLLIAGVLQVLIHRTTYQYDMALARTGRQVTAIAALTLIALLYHVNSNDFIYFQF